MAEEVVLTDSFLVCAQAFSVFKTVEVNKTVSERKSSDLVEITDVERISDDFTMRSLWGDAVEQYQFYS
ncbi:hypothetical protein KF707_21115 [Candidatus Obscuribacterales bacterium]|nr:hypothetical protein [Candidatus Obscuribacterales bacterium]MBX3138744.1 hypothetical protein [Candidatus Obscuribacterales bacterium]MBX3153268.1 hypothetical protein [Candidatus Obscuribacterales bacterium]